MSGIGLLIDQSEIGWLSGRNSIAGAVAQLVCFLNLEQRSLNPVQSRSSRKVSKNTVFFHIHNRFAVRMSQRLAISKFFRDLITEVP